MFYTKRKISLLMATQKINLTKIMINEHNFPQILFGKFFYPNLLFDID